MAPEIVILSGARGAGKSTACLRLAELARQSGHICAGLITLRGEGAERDVLDLASGRQRRLTTDETGPGPHGDPNPREVVSLGPFRFRREVLEWGAAALERATPCDLLVIDELGPLELERGSGWVRAFDLLARGGCRLAVVVIRLELLTKARLRLQPRSARVIELSPENREHVPHELLALLTQQASLDSAPGVVAARLAG